MSRVPSTQTNFSVRRKLARHVAFAWDSPFQWASREFDEVRVVLEPQRVSIIVRLEEDVLHYFQIREVAQNLGERPADWANQFSGGTALRPRATPALHPQMDKNVRTGGSLYLAM